MLDKNALTVATSRYFNDNENSWEELVNRVTNYISKAEGDKQKKYKDDFFDIIYNMYFIPGGRILRNSNKSKGSLFNCYSLPIGDSIEEIGQFYKNALILWSEGGGVGVSFSSLRPKEALIKGKGGVSSGLVSFMKAADSIAKTVESGGSRRAASLGLVSISHPEVIDFINAKLKDKELSSFNISVSIDNSFIESVESNKEWEFKFKQLNYGSINARKLWNMIIKNMIDTAEPGIINWSNFSKNNSYYYDPVVSPNPCQPKWATVLTSKGISTIENIKIGDYIWSEDGFVKVISKKCSGFKNVYRYRTNAGVFYGTEEHRIKSNNEKIEVHKAHSIDALRGNPKQKENFDLQTIVDGLVLGDGSFHKASNNKVFLYIGKKDQDYFNSEIKDFILIKNKISKLSYDIKTTITHNELPMTFLREIPKRFFFNNFNITKSLLRGLFSANGSIIKDQRISYKTSSKYLAEDIQILLSSIGIKSYITINKKKKVKFKNGIYECKKSYDINIVKDTRLFYELIGFIQKYKMDDLKNLLNKQKTKLDKLTFDIFEKNFISNELVYNITVDSKNHTYWTGGCNVSNCAEATLSPYDVCDLGSLVMPNFVSNGKTNWKKLEEVIKLAIRFLDDVIDMNNYVLPENEIKAHNSRRIGLGVMGISDYFFTKQIRYGSKKALDELEKLMKFIRDCSYQTLVELSIEKGSFPKFDPVLYGKASFIKKLPASLRMDVKKYGVRCVTCMALAPNGTISLLANTTSGLEPLFSKSYLRHDRVGDRIYIHPIYESLLKNNEEIPDWFVDSYDLSPEEHLNTQAICQKYVDGAVSKTINLPNDFKSENLNSLLLEYIHDLKGVTVYRDGCREGQICNKLTKKEILEYIKKEKVNKNLNENDVKCVSGKCNL